MKDDTKKLGEVVERARERAFHTALSMFEFVLSL